MINVWIDEITPCLKDNKTGQLIETEVMKIRRKSTLSAYNKKNGWYVDWTTLFNENEIYALVIKGTYDIQGLVAVKSEPDMYAQFVSWMVTAPHNNKMFVEKKKYNGVGGHLFAIAVQLSIENGYGGYITGFASNKTLEEHYIEQFGAEHIGMLHEYQFSINEINGKKIKEMYTYEFSKNEL